MNKFLKYFILFLLGITLFKYCNKLNYFNIGIPNKLHTYYYEYNGESNVWSILESCPGTAYCIPYTSFKATYELLVETARITSTPIVPLVMSISLIVSDVDRQRYIADKLLIKYLIDNDIISLGVNYFFGLGQDDIDDQLFNTDYELHTLMADDIDSNQDDECATQIEDSSSQTALLSFISRLSNISPDDFKNYIYRLLYYLFKNNNFIEIFLRYNDIRNNILKLICYLIKLNVNETFIKKIFIFFMTRTNICTTIRGSYYNPFILLFIKFIARMPMSGSATVFSIVQRLYLLSIQLNLNDAILYSNLFLIFYGFNKLSEDCLLTKIPRDYDIEGLVPYTDPDTGIDLLFNPNLIDSVIHSIDIRNSPITYMIGQDTFEITGSTKRCVYSVGRTYEWLLWSSSMLCSKFISELFLEKFTEWDGV